MVYTNEENDAWNLLHNGSRVPVNDTGIPGAPAAIGSHNGLWREGSLNKAVYDTYRLTGEFPLGDLADAQAGILSLNRLGRFININMMYGFNGDAKGRMPGDALSYRGYPTPVILTDALSLELANSPYDWTLSGALGTAQGDFIILSHSLKLTFAVPYDTLYTVVFRQNATVLHTIEFKITAGAKGPTHYRSPGSEPWRVLPQQKIFFAVDSSSFAGDKTFNSLVYDFMQAPYHGELILQTVMVPWSAYTPPVPAFAYSIGGAYPNPRIFSTSNLLTICSEMSEDDLFNGGGGSLVQLYIRVGETLKVGVQAYTNAQGTALAGTGKYVWADWVYDVDVPVYRVTKYISVDATGKVILYYSIPQGAGSAGCYVQ